MARPGTSQPRGASQPRKPSGPSRAPPRCLLPRSPSSCRSARRQSGRASRDGAACTTLEVRGGGTVSSGKPHLGSVDVEAGRTARGYFFASCLRLPSQLRYWRWLPLRFCERDRRDSTLAPIQPWAKEKSSCQRGSWLAPPLCWASAGQTGRRRAPDGLARARHVAHEPEGRAGGHLHRESSPLSPTSPLWCGLLLRVGLSLCAGGRPDGCGAALCPPGLLLLERVRRPAQPRQPPAPRPAAAPRRSSWSSR